MIRLPEEFKEIEIEINREIKRLEGLIERESRVTPVGSEGRIPSNKEELKLGIYRNPDATASTPKKIILRDEGRNYSIDLTEVT